MRPAGQGGLVVPAEPVQSVSQAGVGVGLGRIERRGSREPVGRLFRPAVGVEDAAVIVLIDCRVRAQRGGAFEVRQGRVRVSALEGENGEPMHRLGVIRIALQHLAVNRAGFVRSAVSRAAGGVLHQYR